MMMLLTLAIWNPPPEIVASAPTPRIVLFDLTRTGLDRRIVPETRMIKGARALPPARRAPTRRRP